MADGAPEPASHGGTEGAKYRFERLSTGLVIHDMYYARSDPGPGDRVPAFDLPTIDGGRFRSADLAEAGALLPVGTLDVPNRDVRAGKDLGLVAVLPAHQVRRRSPLAEHLQDLPLSLRRTLAAAQDNYAIPSACAPSWLVS